MKSRLNPICAKVSYNDEEIRSLFFQFEQNLDRFLNTCGLVQDICDLFFINSISVHFIIKTYCNIFNRNLNLMLHFLLNFLLKSIQQQTTNLAPDLNSVKNLWRHEATSDEPRFAVVSLHKNVYPLLLMQSRIPKLNVHSCLK